MSDDDLYKLVDIVTELENLNTIALYIKWHVDPLQAKRVLHSYAREELGFDDDMIENLEKPIHERWRKIPHPEHGMIIKRGSGVGSFPVTVINLEDWSR